jgi:hypothetical protein
MQIPTSGGSIEVIANRATVLHDDSGRIHHVHTTTILKGGHVPAEPEMEQLARRIAKSRGLPVERLAVLHFQAHELEPHRRYVVDPRSKRLLEAPSRAPR